MMAEIGLVIDLLRVGVGGLVIAVGVLIVCAAAVAALRFPDFYTRLHAAGATETVGAVVMLFGLAILAWSMLLSAKLLLLAGLLAAISPNISQLVANAAHAAGLSPLAGPYVAPRPGEQRKESDH